MTATNHEISTFLKEFEPRTRAERLELLKIAYDQTVMAIANGEAVVEFEIRGRRVRYTNPADLLDRLRRAITALEDLVKREQYGNARNYARPRKA